MNLSGGNQAVNHTGQNQAVITYISFGTSFITFLGILAYHIYLRINSKCRVSNVIITCKEEETSAVKKVKMATKAWSFFQQCLQPELFLSFGIHCNCLKPTDTIPGDVY